MGVNGNEGIEIIYWNDGNGNIKLNKNGLTLNEDKNNN